MPSPRLFPKMVAAELDGWVELDSWFLVCLSDVSP